MNNLQKILNKTFPLERSLISSDNRKTLELFNNIVPLKKWKIKTGTKCFDWTVPKEWIFNKAILKDSNGNILIDGSKNILNVLSGQTKNPFGLTDTELADLKAAGLYDEEEGLIEPELTSSALYGGLPESVASLYEKSDKFSGANQESCKKFTADP